MRTKHTYTITMSPEAHDAIAERARSGGTTFSGYLERLGRDMLRGGDRAA